MSTWDTFLLTVYWFTPGSVSSTIRICRRYIGKQAIDAKEDFDNGNRQNLPIQPPGKGDRL